MTLPQVFQDISSLPPDAQKQVADFVSFLKARYGAVPRKKARLGKLEAEPFVGMWKNRKDMRDSVKWVRELRQREWER